VYTNVAESYKNLSYSKRSYKQERGVAASLRPLSSERGGGGMSTTKQRVAALVMAGILAAAGVFAVSAVFATSEAHAVNALEGTEDSEAF
jgi:hypothetical protein